MNHDHHEHHDHNESCGCGCGHHHDHHDHNESCGCGCGCGHHHEHEHSLPIEHLEGLSEGEAQMLRLIGQYGYLPVARFVLANDAEADLQMEALAPVALDDAADALDVVKQRGEWLCALEAGGLITLDYDIPISGYDYAGYRESALFRQLEQAADEAKARPGFLFNTATMEAGSMALTDRGAQLLGVKHDS